MKTYYTPITFDPVCKNGSWRYGGNACTVAINTKKGDFKMEVNQFGKTKKEAEEKLMAFLTSQGKGEAEQVKRFPAN